MGNRKLLAVFLCFVWVGCGSEDPGTPCGVDLDCDDGNSCTTDICVSGKCGFKGVFSVPCDDGNACTENTTCNDEGICQGGTEIAFDDSPCLICGCDPETGVECLPRNVGDPCSDNDCCTSNDFCDACHPDDPGCNAKGIMCVGTMKECSDDNDCTQDECSCESGEATCNNPDEPDGLPCVEDENACTEGDFCQGGQCLKGAPLNLNDGNPCTDDYCQKGEVINDPALEGQCDDGNECTEDDFCYLGTCTGGDPVICETAPCSASVECKQGEGCVYSWKPEGAECDDENPCSTSEICNEEHQCVGHTFSDCDDFNACTLDACDPNTGGCNNTIITGDCDDGNPCTLTDMCNISGECLGSKVLCEDDDNPCTLNECNTSDGACGVAVEDGLSCADDALCNGEESCQLGVCTSGSPVVCADDANPCTEDACASDSGECNAAVPDDTACDDDDICNGSEVCLSGACEAGATVDCSGVTEPCLENTCNPATGLCDLNTADDTLCPDGNTCNGQETCQGGSCTLGTPVGCPEPEALCTVSYCEGADGVCMTDINPDCCGNSIVETDETCDDGNTEDGDGCSTSCQVDALSASTACTNALVENYADHTYVFCPEGRPWETAREICQTIGSHMVKVEESSENDWVYSVALGQPVGVTDDGASARWIGLNRIEDFDTWVWHDDTAPGFFPQNPASGGDWGDTNRRCAPLLVNAVGASVDGTWMPKSCDYSFAYICEFDTVVPPICGNGLTESGESCDDENDVDGDGCSSTCQGELVSCLDSGLVAHYPFTGGSVGDVSGNFLTGNIQGSSATTDRFGAPNSAWNFGGNVESRIVIPASGLLTFSDTFSISLWAKINEPWNYHAETLVWKFPHPNTTQQGFYIVMNQDSSLYGAGMYELSVQIPSVGDGSVGVIMSYDSIAQWFHVAATYNEGQVNLYLNGVLVGSETGSSTMLDQDHEIYLGGSAHPVSGAFNRDIDDVRFYNCPLSAEEVTSF